MQGFVIPEEYVEYKIHDDRDPTVVTQRGVCRLADFLSDALQRMIRGQSAPLFVVRIVNKQQYTDFLASNHGRSHVTLSDPSKQPN